MTTRKRRETKQRAIVVLDGTKLSEDNSTGMSALYKAEKAVTGPEDEILVLALLYARPSPRPGFRHAQQYIGFLHQEITQKKGDYKTIFRPFYERCKNIGVKFHVKVSAGFRPKDIIIDEANNFKATWILIDSCFTRDLTFRLSGTECNVSLVGDGEFSESSMNMETIDNPKSPKLMKGSTSKEPCFPSIKPCSSSLVPCSTSQESERPNGSELYKANGSRILRRPAPVKEPVLEDSNLPKSNFRENVVDRGPLQLAQEAIRGITTGFLTMACLFSETCNMEDYKGNTNYVGYLNESKSFVLLKKWETSIGILEAEKRAASSMHHKNIMAVKGYHQSDNTTILVFNIQKGLPLSSYLFDTWRKEFRLKFQDKLKIAIALACAVRYMHCECPQGLVVHGDLRPSNIYLRNDLQPMIFGFGKSVWHHHEQTLPIPNNRCCLKDHSNQEKMELIKSDVLSYGVLLLRLFCKKSVPEDDKSLVDWARPLLLQRKFHELLEEDVEVLDMHGIYRVMTAAAECTRTKAISRPSISEVICVLKGQKFCSFQSSPSDGSV